MSSATWTSHLDEFRRRHDRAARAALVAAVLIPEAAVKRKLTGGYTSGAFVTGRVRSSVTHTEVTTEDGVHVIRLGTNVLYALFWELGHFNLFTGKYERVEVWRPALAESRARMARTFAAVYKRMMDPA